MSKLRIALDEYLKVRRSLGYKLLATGSLLRRFVDFADPGGSRVHYHRTCIEVGCAAFSGSSTLVGEALRNGTPVCSVLQCNRLAHNHSAAQPASLPIPTPIPLYLS